MEKLNLYFVIFFSTLGLIISLIFSFFSGNSIGNIIYNILFSSIVGGILGFSVYYVLKNKIPEILEIFDFEYFSGRSFTSNIESTGFDESITEDELNEEIEENNIRTNDAEESISVVTTNEEKVENKNFGDHILVNKISIKNEPKLMAQAIRTMLSKDE